MIIYNICTLSYAAHTLYDIMAGVSKLWRADHCRVEDIKFRMVTELKILWTPVAYK